MKIIPVKVTVKIDNIKEIREFVKTTVLFCDSPLYEWDSSSLTIKKDVNKRRYLKRPNETSGKKEIKMKIKVEYNNYEKK